MSQLSPSSVEMIATILFVCAILHTFFSSTFQKIAHRYPEGSIPENIFHLLGEVEVVFGLWASLFLGLFALTVNPESAIQYAESLNFTEPAFVFVIMTVAATKPVIEMAQFLIFSLARVLPFRESGRELAVFLSCLTAGPLLGSLITEPAAMTVTALILKQRYFNDSTSIRFKYVTIATLFVNISIGGALTPFAAPPVLMVAGKWNWDLAFMLQTFGWRAATATVLNAIVALLFLKRELQALSSNSHFSLGLNKAETEDGKKSPVWLWFVHALFLFLIVLSSHHPVIFIGLFLLFLGVAAITTEYQTELPLRQSLLVAFFLGGLVVLGGLQQWWLDPLLRQMSDSVLFLGTTGLTAFTDNAALTYLGSQLDGISDSFKYNLVAGAIAGGGLTVIANAPNPAGFSILQDRFGESGIHPLKLFLAALIPTCISVICLWPWS